MYESTKIAAALAVAWLVAAPAQAEAEFETAPEAMDAATEAGAPADTGDATALPSSGRVERATFTRAVEEREPQGSIDALANDTSTVFYFTELRDLDGRTVTHRWLWNGQLMAEVPFEVGGPRWRASSSKNLDPTWLGEWTVEVVDESGEVLSVDSFEYTTSVADTEEPMEPQAEESSPAAPADPDL